MKAEGPAPAAPMRGAGSAACRLWKPVLPPATQAPKTALGPGLVALGTPGGVSAADALFAAPSESSTPIEAITPTAVPGV